MNVADLTLEHIDQIGGSEAHFPAIKAWVEIIDSGYGDGTALSISWDDKAAVLKDGPDVVALIAWRELKWTKTAWICVGWTRSDYRRSGLYRRLYGAVREAAKAAGLKYLDGGVSPNNKEILASAAAMGRVTHGITLRDTLA